MKASTFKTGLLLSTWAMISLNCMAKEVTKEYHKSFATTNSSKVYIENSFGDITFQNGNQSQVLIDVVVSVEADNEGQAQKILDKITVTLHSSGNKISGVTELENKLTTNTKENNIKFKIDYTVTLPAKINLDVTNSFGNISIPDLSGETSVELNFGNLNAHQITGEDTNISVSYGSLTIGTLGDADLELAFLEKSKIQSAGIVGLDLSYSSLTFGSVQALNADANFGDIKITSLPENFIKLSIEANMSAVDIGFDPDAGFVLSAEMTMCDLTVPNGMHNVEKEKDFMNSSYSGTYGNGKSKISVESNMGSVDLHLTK